jgi:hypothetical protein
MLLADWTPEELEQAQHEAHRIVDAMRQEGYERLGDFPEDDPLLAALAGIGLLAEPDADDVVLAGADGANAAPGALGRPGTPGAPGAPGAPGGAEGGS